MRHKRISEASVFLKSTRRPQRFGCSRVPPITPRHFRYPRYSRYPRTPAIPGYVGHGFRKFRPRSPSAQALFVPRPLPAPRIFAAWATVAALSRARTYNRCAGQQLAVTGCGNSDVDAFLGKSDNSRIALRRPLVAATTFAKAGPVKARSTGLAVTNLV